jgi:hypothetical protein
VTNCCERCGVPLTGRFCGSCGWAQTGQQATAPRRRRWPWIVAAVLAVWIGGAYYFYQDNERRFAEARNTGVDILSTDPKTGVVTARDKKTGKIITLDMNDIEPDAIRLPIRPYPGAAESGAAKGGALTFTTPDAPGAVVGFYEDELKGAALEVVKKEGPAGAVTLTGTSGNGRKVTVVIRGAGSGATVEISE